tara:strand:+ start:109803 stop:110480 length:678 start_codon:yes stop_codon:yes gene_type:complete
MSLYFKVLLFSFIIPFIFSFHKKIKFYKFFKQIAASLFLIGFFFIIWDIYFTKIGVWGFDKTHHSSIMLSNLPLEEVLFFFVIPFVCVFTYFVLSEQKVFNLNINITFLKLICILFIAFAFLFFKNAYTISVLTLTILILLYIIYYRPDWVGYFFSMYLIIHVFPFLLVNGILTGYITELPPVWYDSNNIIGVRIATIPLEDFLYSFILLFLNTCLFEYLRNKTS